MKSLTVKLWLALLLVLLMAYTGYSLWKKNSNADNEGQHVTADTPAGSDPALIGTVSKPMDLASYTMTERNGESLNFEKLRGQVWILSMFFSSCPNECLQLNRTIAALHRDPAVKDAQFISVSVDPVTDTPKVLTDYATVLGADPKHWLFFTGDMAEISRFGKEAMVSAAYKSHMSNLLLFDRQGKLRGKFTYSDPRHIERLKTMVGELAKEPAKAPAASTSAK